MSSTRVHAGTRAEQDRINISHDSLPPIPPDRLEHYCSDLMNPDLLRSRLTWCAGTVHSDLCASVTHSTKPENAAQR